MPTSHWPQPQSPSILHISDLHFNRVDPEIVEATIQLAGKLTPELVVCSGDVTMRARIREFRAARSFLDALPAPWTCVPGNHDIPAWNLTSRFLSPFHRYRKYISNDTSPYIETDSFALASLNTARSAHLNTLDWSRGRVNRRQLKSLTRSLQESDPSKYRIVVAHHPFALPPGSEKRGLTTRSEQAHSTFGKTRIDLVLTGHLHIPHIAEIANAEQTSNRPTLSVQASTTTSLRLKGHPNSLNAIYLSPAQIVIERYDWSGSSFLLASHARYPR